MAVVGLTEIKGDVQELLAKYDKVNEQLMARGALAPGLLVHTCVVSPTASGSPMSGTPRSRRSPRSVTRASSQPCAARGSSLSSPPSSRPTPTSISRRWRARLADPAPVAAGGPLDVKSGT